ncbi:hypothetical protein O6H91_12G075200 [Diphasiastrum complanatum]|uniref:Uncharacterized protein n=1 Tax=Diphasiastrum complanatum TaxID=34168 RepID=A0ACC2C3P9_DIPCM|nr:hypothetical protein O6H91_12G075200 [Diphasiastrum complanatum]
MRCAAAGAKGNPLSPILLFRSSSSNSSIRIVSRRFMMSGTGSGGGGVAKTALQEMSTDGEFKRTESSFRHWISNQEGAQFPALAGRYHLYISYACPWASRCYAFLKLKGLEDAIGLTVVKPKWERTKEGEDHFGWVFPVSEDEEPGAQLDPINGARTVRELYEIASSNYSAKYTVPVLWDKQKKTIVNNESAEITRMFNNVFNHIAKHPEVDLYPEELRSKIDEVNGWVYHAINNGVYRCGFATKQKPYEEAAKELFDALDRCEKILANQRYMCGNRLTESDIRLFVTLIRFDEVYVVHFKCNKKMLREYPNLFNYTKDIYQVPGIAETVNMYHIKKHYYGSHPSINPYGIIPVGPYIDFSTPHDRERFKSAF